MFHGDRCCPRCRLRWYLIYDSRGVTILPRQFGMIGLSMVVVLISWVVSSKLRDAMLEKRRAWGVGLASNVGWSTAVVTVPWSEQVG